MVKVRKAIIPAAGLGTRFLPQTKAMPKEMLPLIDMPVIQRIVEQCVAAGVEDIIIVTGPQKRAIEDHFDRSFDLEERLRESGKNDKADELKRIANLANFIYVRQKGPTGNATPLVNAMHLIQDEPFFFFFADDFFISDIPEPVQLLEVYKKTGGPVMSLRHVGKEGADRYGMVSVSETFEDGSVKVDDVIEKPGVKNAPSEYASLSGYLLTPNFLSYLEEPVYDDKGEHSVPATLGKFAKGHDLYGKHIEGNYIDTGSKALYARALVEVGLNDPTFGEEFKEYLKDRVAKL